MNRKKQQAHYGRSKTSVRRLKQQHEWGNVHHRVFVLMTNVLSRYERHSSAPVKTEEEEENPPPLDVVLKRDTAHHTAGKTAVAELAGLEKLIRTIEIHRDIKRRPSVSAALNQARAAMAAEKEGDMGHDPACDAA